MTCVRPSARARLSPGGPWAGAGPPVTGTRRRKGGNSGKSSGAAGWLMAAICRQSVFRSPCDRSPDTSSAPDCLASTVACAEVCLSVQSVRENADTNGARSSVPAQTDRTDRQTPAQATAEARPSGALDLSGDLSRGDRKTDRRQIAAINQPAAPDDFPELPTSLRRVSVTPGPAPALEPPGDSLDRADGRTQVIEEETGEWTL